jgi:hypothetical protein
MLLHPARKRRVEFQAVYLCSIRIDDRKSLCATRNGPCAGLVLPSVGIPRDAFASDDRFALWPRSVEISKLNGPWLEMARISNHDSAAFCPRSSANEPRYSPVRVEMALGPCVAWPGQKDAALAAVRHVPIRPSPLPWRRMSCLLAANSPLSYGCACHVCFRLIRPRMITPAMLVGWAMRRLLRDL